MPPNRGGRGRGRGRGRGQYGGGGGGWRGNYQSPSADAMDSFLATAMNGISMQDEARNTRIDRSTWGNDEKLRLRPITFVSAGFIEPLKEFQVQSLGTKETDPGSHGPHDSNSKPSAVISAVEEALSAVSEAALPTIALPERPAPQTAAPTTADVFFLDTTGDENLRRAAVKGDTPSVPVHSTDGAESDSSEEVLLFKGKGRSRAVRTSATRITVHHSQRELEVTARRLQAQPGSASQQASSPEPQPQSRPTKQKKSSSASPQKHATKSKTLAPTSLLDDDNNDAPSIEPESDDPLSDYIKNMDGLEELVAHHRSFAQRDLGGTEEEDSAASDDDDDPDEHNVLTTEGPTAAGSEEDEMPTELDDAELARLLAKQEALGLGSGDLILFDDAAASMTTRNSRRKSSQQNKKVALKSPPPDSASAVANVFDDLDLLMDWDRVNPPRRKSKGKLGEVRFDVSDDELRATMEASFSNDRLKKAERKKEREELRSKGMLGKNADPNDPRFKYPNGMDIDQLEDELRTFLMGSDQILTLPPMDAQLRKVIHEVANKLKLKSKSTGSGDQRRPVLSRTKGTLRFDEDLLRRSMARVHRKTFPRLDKQRRSGPGGGGGGGSSGYAALRYRDGEVVGGSAPELGESNKGRLLLEKMGWTKGTGLGALDNKGILEPVVHVVKNSKAGLGETRPG